MKRSIYPLVALVVLGAFLAWWLSPTQVLKRKTERLLELLSFEKGSGKGVRQAGVYSLNALLAQEVELVSESHPEVDGMRERQELESVYAWLAEHVVESSFEMVSFGEVKIRQPSAEVELTVDGVVELARSKPVDGRHEVSLLWIHDGTEWRLGHARWKKAP